MCGIVGRVTWRNIAARADFVQDALLDFRKRGPDAQRSIDLEIGETRVQLGGARLRITDLSNDADMPLQAFDCVGVMNGAIYNHVALREEMSGRGIVFRTASDTEVALAAYRLWGLGALDRMTGMFSLAIVDRVRKSMLIARDRVGVKPLYFSEASGDICFASTPHSIARNIGVKPNLQYVARGLRLRVFEDGLDDSPFEGVKALPASSFALIDLACGQKQIAVQRYYDLDERIEIVRQRIKGVPQADLFAEIRELVEDATRVRLQGEVSQALQVSGGIDSSIVASVASEVRPGIQAYHYGMVGIPGSEAAYFQDIAAAVPIEPRYIWLNSADHMAEALYATLDAQGAPFCHASVIAQFAIFQAAHADGHKVMLGGEGSDEIFLGYRKFLLFQAIEAWREKSWKKLADAAWGWPAIFRHMLNKGETYWNDRRRYLSNGLPDGLNLPVVNGRQLLGLIPGMSLAERAALDVKRWSLPTLLRYEDRNAAANGMESRLPYLHHPLVELALALPVPLRLGNGYNKYCLRQAFAGKIPDSIRLSRDKRSFPVDESVWIDRGMGAALRALLREMGSSVTEWLRRPADIDEIFSDANLRRRTHVLYEGIALLWLAKNS